jgi:hypothetical protein
LNDTAILMDRAGLEPAPAWLRGRRASQAALRPNRTVGNAGGNRTRGHLSESQGRLTSNLNGVMKNLVQRAGLEPASSVTVRTTNCASPQRLIHRAGLEPASSQVEAARASYCASGGLTWSARLESNQRRPGSEPSARNPSAGRHSGREGNRTGVTHAAGVRFASRQPREWWSGQRDSNSHNRGGAPAPHLSDMPAQTGAP